MSLVTDSISKFRRRIFSLLSSGETEPKAAYNIWANSYDNQPGNLMLDLDETLFSELIKDFSFENKVVADIGCGTSRHWEKLYAKKPAKLIGFDVSEGMLKVLKRKYPKAETYILESNKLAGLEANSMDVIVSTLAIAHIQNIEDAFEEWNRVLKPGGHIIITDYHPVALEKGGNRTFTHEGKVISVKNYVHPIGEIKKFAETLGFGIVILKERTIDEGVRYYYEKQDALHIYERFKGTPIIYGIHLVKQDAAS